MLRPARDEDEKHYRPIAVYLDGLQYHHAIVADDVEKRMALLLSGNWWVYSLNWDDLPEPGKSVNGHEAESARLPDVSQPAHRHLLVEGQPRPACLRMPRLARSRNQVIHTKRHTAILILAPMRKLVVIRVDLQRAK